MAGTIFTSEILGDPKFISDSFIETEYGDRISIPQMMYFIVISITTVGYGDFAPRTTIARILNSFFIVVGVASIYYIQFQFAELWRRSREGSGTYKDRQGSGHVVVVLCVRDSASQLSNVVAGFLSEILHPSHLGENSGWPNVVLFSPVPWESAQDDMQAKTFDDFLFDRGLTAAARQKCTFIVGKLTAFEDLERAQVGTSTMTFLVPDMDTQSPDQDDGQNIFAAVTLRNVYPDLRLRVMLLRPESKELAVQAGIESSRCISSRELKACLLAQNIRCHGLVPMVISMLKSADDEDEEYFLRHADHRRLQIGPMESVRGTTASRNPSQRASEFLEGIGHLDTASPPISPRSEKGNAWAERYSAGSEVMHARSSVDTFVGTKSRSKSNKETTRSSTTLDDMRSSLKNSEVRWCKDKGVYESCDPWMFAYFDGLQRSVYGFELAEEYAGTTFGELVANVFSSTGAITIGVFEKGKLQICPQKTYKKPLDAGQLCFAVARDEAALAPCRLRGRGPGEWRNTLFKMRDHALKRVRLEGVHAAAVALLGPQLRHELQHSSRRGSKTRGQNSKDRAPHIEEGDEEDGSSATDDSEDCSKEDADEGASSPPSSVLTPRAGCGLTPHRTSLGRRESNAMHFMQLVRSDSLKTGRETLEKVKQLRETIEEDDELVVLIVCQGQVWQQVRTFVTALRAPYLPSHPAIVVLAPTKAPAGLFEDCGDRVYAVEGNCLKVRTLIASGIVEAQAIVVMGGDSPSTLSHFHEPLFKDYKVMLCAQEIECWCGISDREVFATYELHESRSVKHLPRLMNKPALELDELILENDQVSSHQSIKSSLMEMGATAGGQRDVNSLLMVMGGEDAENVAANSSSNQRDANDESILFHPRFAAGQVFTPELWGTMLGRMFYMPATIEILEALLMPSRRGQAAYPWQIRVPRAFVNKTFQHLVVAMAKGEWMKHYAHELGLDKEEPTPNSTPRTPSRIEKRMGPAVPLAIYRARGDFGPEAATSALGFQLPSGGLAHGTGGHNYSILAPPTTTVLRAEDWILVLGSKMFGHEARSLGLLRGSIPVSMHEGAEAPSSSLASPR
eukprot:gnl/TRDRNA2_/TRDRNA2_163110_c1_seq1.p1 gnl/TRDRNA2_/TRDRNA2_163110_c1~~gnl/TRDRNA2_/TRDRNA2_163110_c1_seq1.p1  ORF type:complete len:1242 (+),score=194.97 gnl/TRDRNA2_/TRDRNA2_163110_c1_seq1:490-3726(+)